MRGEILTKFGFSQSSANSEKATLVASLSTCLGDCRNIGDQARDTQCYEAKPNEDPA